MLDSQIKLLSLVSATLSDSPHGISSWLQMKVFSLVAETLSIVPRASVADQRWRPIIIGMVWLQVICNIKWQS